MCCMCCREIPGERRGGERKRDTQRDILRETATHTQRERETETETKRQT
jgi:hypothetical protein